MLIQALCSYADQLAERAGGQKIPDGWSEQKISFEVLLTPEGKIGDILDIRNAVETPQKKGQDQDHIFAQNLPASAADTGDGDLFQHH